MTVVAGDVISERQRFVDTLRAAGPDAPTAIDGWSAADLAVHMAAQDRFGGVPALIARSVVARTGLRLTGLYLDRPRMVSMINGRPRSWQSSLRRLSASPPRAVLAGTVAILTLWEHFTHHEDVRRPNGLERSAVPDLTPVMEWLLRYNRHAFEDAPVRLRSEQGRQWHAGDGRPQLDVAGPLTELVLWLSGRGGAASVESHGDDAVLSKVEARLRI